MTMTLQGKHHTVRSSSQDCYIVESYTNSKTVEQKAMFTIYKVLSKTHVHTLQQFDCQIVTKCEHEFYSTLYKV